MICTGVSLLILAGGESSRMGFPKHLLPASGGTITDHIINRMGGMFGEVMVSGRGLEQTRPDVKIVEDVRGRRSPLVGILSGILAAENPYVFVTGCDMPFVKRGLIRYLTSQIKSGTEIIIPVVRGYYEPLCGVYSCSLSERIAKYLDSGGSKVTGFFGSATVTEISESIIRKYDPALKSFINMNTPKDYENWYLAAGSSR
ncbi:MAG: molybdenum cofactor guanylyltransferase [Candidatus Sabulitectum sp.]|nr:molybdenum cofactor guanylyltransferase [Candidatus Sabulitectum sp.]